MTKDELMSVYGGAGFSAALVSALYKVATTLYDMGRRLGTAIVRSKTNKLCSF